jgi:hypothetical protein
MKIVYIAEDGRKFTDEDECIRYENSKGFEKCRESGELLFFTASGKQMEGELYQLIENSTFIYVSSLEALNILFHFADMEGYEVPQHKGLWEYVESVGWINVKNRIKEFMKQETLYNFINEIMEED